MKFTSKLRLEFEHIFPDENAKEIIEYIHGISIQYNIDKKNIIKNYFNYIIRNKKQAINENFLLIVENIMHSTDSNIDHLLHYFVHNLMSNLQTVPN